jgi:hypothetical protein
MYPPLADALISRNEFSNIYCKTSAVRLYCNWYYMAAKRTALGRRLTEQRKARTRLPLLVSITLLVPALAGIRSISIWVCYLIFIVMYSLWALRLTTHFADDRRLGYLLCLTDLAVLLPLLVWSRAAAVQLLIAAACVAGVTLTYLGDRADRTAPARVVSRAPLSGSADPSSSEGGPGTPLERAVRVRLGLFRATGARFVLVVLRVLRFEETASYYGEGASQRVLTAVSRRGMRLLGPDAQHFVLPGGRVAFLFETDSRRPAPATDPASFEWSDPADIEGLAMSLGRKACEHLVDGLRVECVVGWASAPADGLNADDLMYVAEAGAQSTDAFRRVAGGKVTVPERARVAAG